MTDAIKKILVPVDGSKHAESALQLAGVLAKATDAEVEVVYVREPAFLTLANADIGMVAVETVQVSQKQLDEALEEQVIKPAMKTAREKLAPYTKRIETTVLEGQPAKTICIHASENNTDLIVIGSRGRSAFTELTLGSVSSQVLHHAPCAVTVVRGQSD